MNEVLSGTSQSTTGTEEAKDFKVVVTLSDPPEELRPGLSATAKITTARRQNVLTIPIQALAMRTPASLKGGASMQTVNAASDGDSPPANAQDPGTQGVFVLRSHGSKLESQFAPVTTGITGATDIEVLTGLNDGDTIINGTYQVIRTILNEAQVKVDNKSPVVPTKT